MFLSCVCGCVCECGCVSVAVCVSVCVAGGGVRVAGCVGGWMM